MIYPIMKNFPDPVRALSERLEFNAVLGHVSISNVWKKFFEDHIENDLIMARESSESVLMTVSIVLCNKYCVTCIHSL